MPERPQCGSTSTKEAPSRGEGFVIVRDRICDDCGVRFQPPIPGWAVPLLLAGGVLLIVAAIGLVTYFVVSADPAKWRNANPVGMLVILLLSVGSGMVVTARKIMRGEDPGNRIL